jgi:hypothetical protein
VGTWATETWKDREVKKGIRENREEKRKKRNEKKEISPNNTWLLFNFKNVRVVVIFA